MKSILLNYAVRGGHGKGVGTGPRLAPPAVALSSGLLEAPRRNLRAVGACVWSVPPAGAVGRHKKPVLAVTGRFRRVPGSLAFFFQDSWQPGNLLANSCPNLQRL
jgi:hypothetical protein